MKTSTLVLMCLALTLTQAQAQAGNSASANGTTLPVATSAQVVASGPNHRVWQWQTYEPTPNGQLTTRTHQYTELASGLNYQNASGQWVASQEIIESYADGAIARQGQYQVIFANNLNSAGAIDMQTPDGKRVRSNILGLMYDDPASGKAVVIAQVQDSQGELVADNQVLYTNAFNGVKADVLYTYRRDGMEQDVILRQQPPAPEAYGLNSATTELEVFTAFPDAPAAVVRNNAPATSDSELDQAISWGTTTLGQGKAFSLGGEDVPAPVAKRYLLMGGQYYLLEKVKISDIKQALQKLPEQASNAHLRRGLASRHLVLPKAPKIKSAARPIRLARGTLPDQGYVLDYVSLNTAYTNYVFQGDNTYYVSGNLNLSGTNTFEGGAVIKYAANAAITCVSGSQVSFVTAPYRPVVFTAKDDNTIGELISGSTGTPSGYYASPALNLGAMGAVALADFRVSYAGKAISASGASPAIYDAQLANCALGIADLNGALTLENVLFSNVKTNFNVASSANAIFAQNATFRNNFDLINGSFGSTYLYLTNCIFVNVTNLSGNLSAGYNGFYQSVAVGSPAITNTFYPLQAAGSASCYLTNGCAFFNAGTTNIDSYGLGLIETKTTYAPIIYSNVTLSAATTFSPQASRDTDTPDLGYHYAPLDYCFGGVHVASNVVFTAGTAVGWFELPGSGGPGYGLGIVRKVNVSFNGLVTQPDVFTRYSTVQEGGNNLWKDKGYLGGIANVDSYSASDIPGITARFTLITKLAADSNHYRDGASGQPVYFQGTDCEFLNGGGGYNIQNAFTNCLMVRGGGGNSTSSTYAFEIYVNCTFHGGALNFGHGESSAPYWYSCLRNCAFENTTFAIDHPTGITNYASYDYNSFLTGTNEPPTEGTHTIIVTNGYNWQSSWLGNYYLPSDSPLINAGSTTADLLGLYHFTTQPDQVKETNSVVDIGYHYVAMGGDSMGMVGYWPLDEGSGTTAYDYSGYGDEGTLVSSPAWVPGQIGTGALDFNGDNYVIVSNSPALEVGASGADFTVSYWLFLKAGHTGNWRNLMHKGNTDDDRTFAMWMDPSDDQLYYRISTSAQWDDGGVSASALPIGQWVYVAYVKAGGQVQLYLNGTLDSAVTLDGTSVYNDGPIYFGKDPWYDGTDCRLDDIRIYARALSASEVAASQVAALADGVFAPSDQNGDKTPDYLQDANGDGLVDDGETNWLLRIATQPADKTAPADSVVVFSVVAQGLPPISYQWQFNGTNLAGETYSNLVMGALQNNQAGIYSVVVANSGGAITSSPAILTVCTPTMDALSNLTVFAGSGAHTIALTGISGGCSLYQTLSISASSSNTNVIADPSIDYLSSSNRGSLTFIPSTSSTGAVYITVILQDTNLINGLMRISGDLYIGPAHSLSSLTTFISATNSLDYIEGLSRPPYNLTNGSPVYFEPFVFNPSQAPLTSFMTMTNNGKVFSFDLLKSEIEYQADDAIIMSFLGIAHLSGFQDTYGFINVNQDFHGLDWVATTYVASFGGLNQVTNIFEVNVVAPTNLISVQILSPTNQTFNALTTVALTALTSNSSASIPIRFVEFFDGTNGLGYALSTNNSWSLDWTPWKAGTNILTALAVASNGISAWSGPVTNYVRSLPRVAITSPTSGQIFSASPTNVAITTSASSDGATITNVTVYQGTNVIGTTNVGSPTVITWDDLTNGNYTIYARAIDTFGAVGSSSNISFTIEPTNAPPVVYAGTDQILNLWATNRLHLNGWVADDGLPLGSSLSIVWTNLSGGAGVTFLTNALPQTDVSFQNAGTYLLQLIAGDSQYTTTSTVTITVYSNQPPLAYAGTDQFLTNATAVQLQGSASDDGYPNGMLITTWSQVSGPPNVAILNPNSTNSIVTFLTQGSYVFQLSAFDGDLTSTSDVAIHITSTDPIPIQADGYRYFFASNNDELTNFQSTNFDDSRFMIGPGGFGDGLNANPDSDCPFDSSNYVRTYWPPYQASLINSNVLLLRRHFTIPAGTTNLNLSFSVDNEAEIYINGVLIDTTNAYFNSGNSWYSAPFFIHIDCESYPFFILNNIDTNFWHTNDNLIAVRACNPSDWGGGPCFFDLHLYYDAFVVASNQAPLVDVAADKFIASTNYSANLYGLVFDDGLPGNGTAMATWKKASGPGIVTFFTNNLPFTNFLSFGNLATFSAPGTYVLEFTANDSLLSATGDVTLVVGVGEVSHLDPDVSITSFPLAYYAYGVNIPLSADATAYSGTISKVDFYASSYNNGFDPTNEVWIGEATQSPYTAVWQAPLPGNYYISATATDSGGGVGYSGDLGPFTILGDRAPVAKNDQFSVQADSLNNILTPLINDYDPDGDDLTIVAVQSSTGASVSIADHGKAISYSPPAGMRSYPGQIGDGFSYEISDGRGGTNWAGIYIIIDASDTPQVGLTPSVGYQTNAGANVPLTASVLPLENIVKVDFYLGKNQIGEITNGPGGDYTLNWPASYDDCGCAITAQATDKYGQVGTSQPITIDVIAPTNGNLVASLDRIVSSTSTNDLNATNLTTIRDGIFNLYGQAFHSMGSNVTWQLRILTVDGTLLRDLTPTTTGTVGSSSTWGDLMTCDLSTLKSGVYDLRLTVTGGYQTTDATVQIDLESNLKIGQFSFSQQDLIIPVNGIPLTVIRTYNSINPSKGDFGYGWTYALSDMDVSLDETREYKIDVAGDAFSQRSGGSWDVTLTLPNGRRTTFYFSLVPASDYGTFQSEWNPVPGVTATLQAQDNAIFYDFSGLSSIYPLSWTSGESQNVPLNNFDFKGFILTTLDGTKYYINREDLDDHTVDDGGNSYYVHAYGAAYLSKIDETNGEEIQINSDSIVFVSTNNVTKKITFERNNDGLISSISDPISQSGSGLPTVQYQYDQGDNLISVASLVDGSGEIYVTNFFTYTNITFPHFITGIFNDNGAQVAKNFYDDSGKLTAIEDANGGLTQFIHDLTNDSEMIIDRLGNTNTYVYDSRGNVIVQTNQLGQIMTMAYDDLDNKTNEVSFLNGAPYATNSYRYNPLNLMTDSIDSLGNHSAFAYNALGELTVSTDARGFAATNIYDANGNLIQSADALGDATANTYNGGLLASSQDALGTTTINYYDANDNLTANATLDASGSILSSNTFAYDANLNRTNSTLWRQVDGVWTPAMTAYVYDAMNREIETVYPDAKTSQTIYDNTGKAEETIDQNGYPTSFAYDLQGRLIQTRSQGPETREDFATITNSYAYDANGNRISATDPLGRTTRYVYDSLNRLVQTIYPDATTNATLYDEVGRVAQTIDARGTITGFAYDTAGRRLAVTNAFGTSVATTNFYTYDSNGNQLTFTDGNFHATTNVYDALNRQVQVKFPDGTTTSTGYDADGRRITQTNQDNLVTGFGYDGAGRLTSVTNSLNQVTRYQYDEAGNELAQIDALNRTNRYAYDDQGRRVAHWMPDTNLMEQFAYDGAGNLIYHTNFDGYYLAYSYDPLNHVFYSYDQKSSYETYYRYFLNGARNYITRTDDQISYEYDNRDRLISVTNHPNSGYNSVINYSYDANGNLINLATLDGAVDMNYAYDALNRLTNAFDQVSRVSAGYAYDGAGNLVGTYYGNGVTNHYQYDLLNRMTNLVWKSGASAVANFGYGLGASGNRTNLVENVHGAGQSYAWSFDNLYRLTMEKIGTATAQYAYDPVGNRTSRTSGISGLPTAAYSYNTNDWLAADEYDADGNTTNSLPSGALATNYYQYDAMNRLIDVNNGGIILGYDDAGNRLTKTVGGVTTTTYVVDEHNPSGYPQVIEEYVNDGGNVKLKAYDYGLGLISQQQLDVSANPIACTNVWYYGYDGHGSVRFLMDTNGTVTDTYAYDAYGTLLTQTGSTQNNRLYCGYQWDSDLNLYYDWARYLNTGTGRFWTMDSYEGDNEDPLSLHKYLYCNDNPLNGIDPSGHEDLVELEVATGIGEELDSLSAVGSTVAKRAVTAKLFDFDLGFEWGAGSGGWGPHSFLYVPNKLTGIGLKYDITDRGSLLVKSYPKNIVQSEAWFGKLIKIADFNLPQYISWSATAYITAEGTKDETQLLDQQVIRSLGLQFSYSFFPGTVNCFKWTIIAGVEGYVISKVGN